MRRTIARKPSPLRGALGLVTASLFGLLGLSLLPKHPALGAVLLGLAALRLVDLVRWLVFALRGPREGAADSATGDESDADEAGGPQRG